MIHLYAMNDPKATHRWPFVYAHNAAEDVIRRESHELAAGADVEDVGLTIHPHPTLSETLCFAAEMGEGTITDLMPPRKRKK